MNSWIEQTFLYRYVALANSNDDEMIAPRILFCDYSICTRSTSELLATHILIHILKSSTKNSENGSLIETQLEKYFTCDTGPVKSRIRYKLCSIWGQPPIETGSVDAMSFWYNYVFTIVISAVIEKHVTGVSFFCLFICLFIYYYFFTHAGVSTSTESESASSTFGIRKSAKT